MNFVMGSDIKIGMPLRNKIRLYKKRAQEIESCLSKKPKEWGKFQSEFNQEVNSIFHDIMNFEKANLSAGREDKVYKLKRLFVDRVRKIFVRGTYIKWSLCKPFGYAGDFKIIDDIYENNPTTIGFDRLFDNYFQMSKWGTAPIFISPIRIISSFLNGLLEKNSRCPYLSKKP